MLAPIVITCETRTTMWPRTKQCRDAYKMIMGSMAVMALGTVSLDLTCPNGKILKILRK